MAGDRRRPRWRQAVDQVDRRVTPRANAFVRTSLFADLMAARIRLEVQLRRRLERQTTAFWHLLNLPTVSDQRSLRAQLVAIQAQLRQLQEQLEDLDTPSED